MSQDVLPLKRLISIKEIHAAFVVNNQLEVIAREVANKYTDQALSSIGRELVSFTELTTNMGAKLADCRITYESYGIWLKVFGHDFPQYLIVFYDKEAEGFVLSQPINLAVLNLEKYVQNVEEDKFRSAAQRELVKKAQKAEREIYETSGEDSNQFFAKMAILATYFIGPLGYEILQNACRDLGLILPITTRQDMQGIVNYCAEYLQEPKQTAALKEEAGDLIDRILVSPTQHP